MFIKNIRFFNKYKYWSLESVTSYTILTTTSEMYDNVIFAYLTFQSIESKAFVIYMPNHMLTVDQ